MNRFGAPGAFLYFDLLLLVLFGAMVVVIPVADEAGGRCGGEMLFFLWKSCVGETPISDILWLLILWLLAVPSCCYGMVLL